MMAKKITYEDKIVKDKKVEFTCDFCDKSWIGRGSCCLICGADICSEHRHVEIDQCSDYNDTYCLRCWNEIGEKYRKMIKEEEEKIEDLEKAWYKEAIEAREKATKEIRSNNQNI